MLRSLFPFFLLGIVAVLVAVWAWPEGPAPEDEATNLSRREEAGADGVGPGRLVDLDRRVEAPRPGNAAPDPSAASPDLAERRSRLQALRDEGKRDELRLALSETVLDDRLPSRLRERSLGELRDLNRELVFRGTRSALACASVKAVRNDSLTTMARRVKKAHGNNVTPAMIMLVNGLRGSGIQLGQTLAIPTGNIEVMVRKADFRLYVLVDDVVVLDYPVGLGRDGSTPVGEFTISGKTRDPDWRAPDGRMIPFGHAEHIIGNRWMGFDDAAGRTGYGIHGTVDEDSIGKQESDGCIRMGKADVEALFDLVPEGCRVVVRP